MSVISSVIENDIVNCRELVDNDVEIKEVNETLYKLLEGLEQRLAFDIEDTVSRYVARITRLVYVQGLCDAVALHSELKKPAIELIKELD